MSEQSRAHYAVSRALRTGRLQRSAMCEKCGTAGRTDAHHEDYSQPLVVIWLCRSCHGLAHHALRLRTDRKAEMKRRVQAAKKAARVSNRMITWQTNAQEISGNRVLAIIMKQREQREQGRQQKAG